MRTLFTADFGGMNRRDRDDALEMISDALRQEFPAYYVAEAIKTDLVAAFVISSVDNDAPIPAHLNGWGAGPLTLKLVA